MFLKKKYIKRNKLQRMAAEEGKASGQVESSCAENRSHELPCPR